LAVESGDETHVVIELPPEAATAAGQMVRLLRARFADAFLLPASALSRMGEGDRVLLVAPTGRAEVRSVVLVDRTAADAVITQGLDAGDAVIVETSQPVGAGERVRTTEAMGE
jgi:UDP-N-acetyl-D-mannosaminuronate dehydrogenase